jgi:hypothetical protein
VNSSAVSMPASASVSRAACTGKRRGVRFDTGQDVHPSPLTSGLSGVPVVEGDCRGPSLCVGAVSRWETAQP